MCAKSVDIGRADGPAASDPNHLAGWRFQVAAVDPERPVHDVRAMDGVMSNAVARRQTALMSSQCGSGT
jgi:hypothetical protein